MNGGRHNQDIQALRGLAIVMVVAYHVVAAVPGLFARLQPVSELVHGARGVDLFFAISGYVITASIFRRVRTARPSLRETSAFWVRRMVRTVIPAWLWLGVFFVFALQTGWFGPDEWVVSHARAAALQVANFHMHACVPTGTCGPFGYYWSLSVEEQFYVALPLAMLVLPRRAFAYAALATGLALTLLLTLSSLQQFHVFRVDGLLLGAALAGAERSAHGGRISSFAARHRQVTVAVAAFAHAALWFGNSDVVPIGLAAVVVVATALPDARLALLRLPLTRVLAYFGRISYSMYLVHMMVILGLQNFLYTRFGLVIPSDDVGYRAYLPLLLLAIVALSELSYRIVERPSQRLGRSLGTRIDRGRAPQRLPSPRIVVAPDLDPDPSVSA